MGVTPEYIVQGLMARGMSRAAALGFAGNFKVESRFDPGINEIAPLVEGSRGGFGLAQWTGPRRRQLEAYAAEKGRNVADPDLQMDFLMLELGSTEKAAAERIFAASDPAEAARLVSTEFLRPGIPHLDARIAAANEIAGLPVTVGASASGSGSVTGPLSFGGAGNAALMGGGADDTLAAPALTPTQQRAIKMQAALQAMFPDLQATPNALSAAATAAQPTLTPTQQRAAKMQADMAALGWIDPAPAPSQPASPPAPALGAMSNYSEMQLPGPMEPPPAYGAGAQPAAPTPLRTTPAGEIITDLTAPSRQMTADFAGGLTGGPSPTYGMLPDAMGDMYRKPISVLGDLGGVALGGLGTLVSGAAGAVGEAANALGVPRAEKLAEELLMMSQFAVPELAGASSVAAMPARVAPRTIAANERLAATEGMLSSARSAGIPVMTTDVLPPTTGIGKWAKQTVPEGIPIAGTGGPRAAQQTARIEAVRDLARQYGADDVANAPDDIMADLLATRGAAVEKFSALKNGVIEKLSGPPVPLPKTIAAIDNQIAALESQKLASNKPVIDQLLVWRDGLLGAEMRQGPAGQRVRVETGQPLNQVEAIRGSIGEAYNNPELAGVRGVAQKALNAVYGPLRDDMADYIRATGGETDLTKWGVANKELADGIKELGVSAFKAALSKGGIAPESVMRMVTGKRPSEMRLLYDNLSPAGRARVQSAIISDVIEKSGGVEAISPERFLTDMKARAGQLGVFFSKDDQAAIKGLQDVLNMTRQASQANVNPSNGARVAPYAASAAAGGLASELGATGAAAAVVATSIIGGVGGIARVYESPAIRNLLMRYGTAKPKDKPGIQTQLIVAINALAAREEDRR